jgi:hypothetical protein
MMRKLILAVMVFVLCFTGTSGMAVEKQDGTTGEKQIQKTNKCWKCISWIDRTTSMGNGTRAGL